uniref:hypothetical protein n=1 Tax=Roseovarius indicus TaxID=540747 RepID=UPI003B528317
MLVLLPRIGELAAVLLELPVMLGLSWALAGVLVARFAVPATGLARAVMGGVGFALFLAAEMLLAVTVFGQQVAAHLAHYATLPGAVGLAGQVGFGLMPLLRRMA